ncbi:cadmium-translocating P-type ATPase [Deinococcus sp. Arct2-2]|uniref:heavy metal translocating P-type ATPase n=1 Tax=Deinococcus sp. Arct2-2 TaxID=2568653 RepID=UPI0010A2BA41|nr:heavy metal translocating P-type ATPase [Deinococcus sp. Arct2-2]THF69188.1 cadmium-translocating P-type ATPase [Deinococcus sp. Arct2-2]
MTAPAPASGTALTRLDYFVEGMDCPTCVRKIEGALERTPGAANASTNLTKQSLTLTLDESQTPRAALEKTLRSLGHEPRLLNGDGSDSVHTPRPWYATQQGRLVLTSGTLLVLAFLFGLVEPALATWGYLAATLLGTWPLAKKAWAAGRAGDPFSINTLVSLAAVGALLIGEGAEAAVVVFFFAIGELLEGIAVGRARSGIQALAALAPKTALVLKKGKIFEVPADTLKVGQFVQVQPGGRVPADGTILEGQSSLDDSPVTGESVPVFKTVGDAVYAGSINTDGVLKVRVDTDASDNTIARIIHLVEQAESNKAPVARFIDRFSRVYTPIVVLIAGLTAVLPPLLAGGSWSEWLYKGISLLLIGCPCALVLSVPAAITSAVSAGARRGLLIKGGAALEAIGSVKTIAFDKTGTLTQGKPQVTDIVPFGIGVGEVLRQAAAVEQGSSHPLAKAILGHAQGLALPAAEDARALPGQAVLATVDGRTLAVGSPRYAQAQGAMTAEVEAKAQLLEGQGKTVVALMDGARVLGLLALRDEPRADAREAVAALKALGIRPLMLTGDNARTGQAIGESLGLDVQAELLPADKLRVIEELKRQGSVAMVGDGINDAPALAASDVGIAMGGGTDVALETADAALLRAEVGGVVELVQLSRATLTNIKQNVIFAVGLKAIFLVTTLLGITGLWPAILSDTGATALVTANALRLLHFRGQRMGQVASPAGRLRPATRR